MPALLDDLDRMRRIDTRGMVARVLDLPEQCARAAETGASWSPSSAASTDTNLIVISGLGSSGLAGDMLSAIGSDHLGVPLIVSRDYRLPGFVDRRTLVVCMSYSGGTEETIETYAEARKKGANIACITSGGRLARMAEEDGVNLLRVPGGLVPRVAIGYMFVSLMFLLERLDLLRPISGQLEGTISTLKSARDEWQPESPADENEAKLLALELHERIPIFYGSPGVTCITAYRWKCQCNENAKVHAFHNIFPEMNRNEMLGWELANLESEAFAAVFIRDPDDSTRLADRIHITATLIPRGFMSRTIELRGDSPMERLLWGFLLGDLASVYLAALYEIDPSQVTGIDRLKEELARIP